MPRKLSIAAFVVVFGAGLVVGGCTMNVLEVRTRSTLRGVLRAHFRSEQDFLAIKAAQEGDDLAVLGHRWAALHAVAGDGSRVFGDSFVPFDSDFWLTFKLLRCSQANRNRTEEGFFRGKLAAALETLGYEIPASEQWEQARSLVGVSSVDDMRSVVNRIKENDEDPEGMRVLKELYDR